MVDAGFIYLVGAGSHNSLHDASHQLHWGVNFLTFAQPRDVGQYQHFIHGCVHRKAVNF